ncbi:Rieske 2Fe-2S domain-containing protein [Phycisphaeraceae bacterium D3-23]
MTSDPHASDADWTDLAAFVDLPPGARVVVDIEGLAVLVLNDGGTLRALANTCPHAMLPLGDGPVCTGAITCPHHGLSYDLSTGENLDEPDTEPGAVVFATRTKNGRVQARISAAQRARASNFTPPPPFR